VKPTAFDYRAPATLGEALALLKANIGTAKLLAGGQSLMPVLNFRLASPGLLIDLNRIPSLAGIREEADGSLTVGAMTRNRSLERSPVIRRAIPLLHAAMPYIAHVQIRNRGTIGGSLAHADPAAELPAVCVACDAEFSLAGANGERVLKAEEFFVGLFSTALADDEILTSIRFPAWPPSRRSAFLEVSRRRGDFAVVGVALTLDLDPSGRCAAARIVVFGAADRPQLVRESAALLQGKSLDADLIRTAASAAAASITPRSDHHASAEYRGELVEVLTRRALEQAALAA
jgi:aerobic carbon-monoxide dehydrogenase medium subunit